MRGKLQYLLGVIQLISCPTFAQVFPVNEQVLDVQLLHAVNPQVTVEPFCISELVTVREFKTYLEAVKRDSSSTFYAAQLPRSGTMNASFVKELLASPELQDQPMPGVSWVVARNYCKWLSRTSYERRGVFEDYELPYACELMAFRATYGAAAKGELECWAMDAYEESIYEFSNGKGYNYVAIKDDPPAMKRKVIFGGSYHMDYLQDAENRFFQYEYQDSSSRYVGFRFVKRPKKGSWQSLDIDGGQVRFNFAKNRLDGIYQESYPNGQLKVLGAFEKGQRMGIWSVWDEQGNLKIQREYNSNTEVDFIVPKTTNPYAQLYAKYPEYTLTRNKQGFFPYRYVEEAKVKDVRRNIRQLTTENEPELFKNTDFKEVIGKLFEQPVRWYAYGWNGDFKVRITGDTLTQLKAMSAQWDYGRIEVKEDVFFYTETLLTEIRQVAISFYANASDAQPSYTVYYPDIRPALATFPLLRPEVPRIQNLDDFFFFHGYRGTIRAASASKAETVEDLKIEIEELVHEHTLWLLYGR